MQISGAKAAYIVNVALDCSCAINGPSQAPFVHMTLWLMIHFGFLHLFFPARLLGVKGALSTLGRTRQEAY